MWKQQETDSKGNPTGPIMTANQLNDLVQYLRQSDNQGIDHFLDHLIQNPSTPTTYNSFITAFEDKIELATFKEEERKMKKDARVSLQRHKKIDLAIKAISQIIAQTTESNIIKWTEEEGAILTRSMSYYANQRNMMHRMLLLYREIPYLKGKWYLTYDTGYPVLDKQLHAILDSLLKQPEALSHTTAEEYGKTLYLSCRDHAMTTPVPGIWLEEPSGSLREGFSERYRREYVARPSSFPPWRDLSENRNP